MMYSRARYVLTKAGARDRAGLTNLTDLFH